MDSGNLSIINAYPRGLLNTSCSGRGGCHHQVPSGVHNHEWRHDMETLNALLWPPTDYTHKRANEAEFDVLFPVSLAQF